MNPGVVAEYEELYRAGGLLSALASNLHGAADYVRDALKGHGEDAQTDAFAGELFRQVGREWSDACTELYRVLQYSGDAMEDSGEALRQIVEEYALSDTDAAEALDNVRPHEGLGSS